jgi:hypothetical protein
MRYVILSYKADGSVNVFGTANGSPFASLDAAKDGIERLLIHWRAEPRDTEMYVAPIESTPNLRGSG